MPLPLGYPGMVGRCGFDPLPRAEPGYSRLGGATAFPFPWPSPDSNWDRAVSKTAASTNWARGPIWRSAEGMIPKPCGSSRLAGGGGALPLRAPNVEEGGGIEPLSLQIA